MCTRLPFISWSIAGVPSSQALSGYLITAPPSVCVPAAIGVLAVWIQQQQKKKMAKPNIYIFSGCIPTNKQTNKQANKQTKTKKHKQGKTKTKQTNKQTNKQLKTNKQSNKNIQLTPLT